MLLATSETEGPARMNGPPSANPVERGLIEHEDCILLVIDLQDGFLAKLDEARAMQCLDRVRFLVEVAKGLQVPLFVTVEDPGRNGWITDGVSALLDPGLAQRDKRVFGLCGQPDLAEAMRGQPRRTAVLVGLETDVCILHSAVGLKGCGFRAVIVSDAVAAPGEEHAQGLARAAALGVELIHAKGLFYEWTRSLDGVAALKAKGPIAPPVGSLL